MTTKVSSKGQIVLPSAIRARDHVEAGQEFEVKRLAEGEYRLSRRTKRPNEGVVDWLLSCPVKGFYEPFRSEGINTL